MFRKITYLATLALILSVVQVGAGTDPDPALEGWWPFDGHAIDVSGNGRNGTLVGTPGFVPGVFGQALELDGDDYVTIDGYKGVLGTSPFSITAWVRTTNTAIGQLVHWGTQAGGERVEFRINSNRLRISHGNGNVQGDIDLTDGEWHHVAVTVIESASASSGDVTFYVDGEDDTRVSSDPDTWNITPNATYDVTIGYRPTQQDRLFIGSIDDVRIYSKVLTQEEIQQIMLSGEAEPYPFALNPSPQDGALLEAAWVSLGWSPGQLAVSHDVYIGESLDDVNDGTGDTFAGNYGTNSLIVGFPGFPISAGLVPGTTYYWRVDEVNDADPNSPWKGPVWSFTVPPRNAYNLDPADGDRLVDRNASLSWTGGFGAKLHHVYFGETFADVNEGAPAADHGAIPETSFTPGTLDPDKTYYWRVDEFDGAATLKGQVLSFETFPDVQLPIADPNLVGWWKLDEGPGSVGAIDSSGYGHHGDIIGDVQSTAGYDGDALELLGGYVQMKDYKGVLGAHAFSISIWVKTSVTDIQELVWWGTQSGGQRVEFRIHSNGHIRMGAGNGQVDCATKVTDGQWHHIVATVIDGATNSSTDVRVYVDGKDDTLDSTDTDTFNLTSGLDVTIGYRPSPGDRNVQGAVDDVRIYDKVLTPAEIEQIMRIDPARAWNASPRSGSTPDIESTLPLAWSKGDKASGHDVYFGLDRSAVESADTSDATGVYRGRQGGTTYSPPEGVEWAGGPYYWRVDENNNDGTVTKGGIWSFSVADYVLIDDFEGYNDIESGQPGSNLVYETWADGYGIPTNGSTMGYAIPFQPTMEYVLVHGGEQSAPMAYDNTTAAFSEVTRTVAARDWTAHGIGFLSLWSRGYPLKVGGFTEGPGGTYTMTAAGADIGGTADQFHFAYRTLTGAGSIIARIDSIRNTHDQAKAGVMIRATLDPNSAHAFACLTPGNGVGSLGRTAAAGSAFATYQAGVTAPHWVKLERDITGTFTVSHSTNGSTWEPVELSIPTAIAMDGTVYVGLAVTSHNNAEACEAKFSNVTVTGTAGMQWMHQDIGILANDTEPLYVAVTDGAGVSAVVQHDDANASTTDVWTEWLIDLQTFAGQGVNLANVDKLSIGLGTRGNAGTPGGSGTMLFDDIKLLRPTEQPQL